MTTPTRHGSETGIETAWHTNNETLQTPTSGNDAESHYISQNNTMREARRPRTMSGSMLEERPNGLGGTVAMEQSIG